jgi:ribosome maturation factor RimP
LLLERKFSHRAYRFVETKISMALQMDEIRRLAERVAASHHLEVVDLEFGGGGKSRALRVFLEKDAAERKLWAEKAAAGEVEDLPKGVHVELLSGVMHEDCVAFATDFGTLLDVEDVVPGSEYTLEVSSPGLERSLKRPQDFERFAGSLVKVKTFIPVNSSRIVTGRLTGFAEGMLKIDLAAVKQKAKAKKPGSKDQGAGSLVEIELKNVEKANLVVEI